MNRFLRNDDKKKHELGDFEIPVEWWSRPFEYAFAIDFLKEKDRILDVGCGLEHPFKNYASKIVKEVVALDKDRALKKIKDTKKIKYVCEDILNFKDEDKFDKIFCISTLEHTQTFMIEKLKNMAKLLKDKGRIIITADYPLFKPEQLIKFSKKAGLKLDGKPDYDDKENAIYSDRYNIYCYTMILKK